MFSNSLLGNVHNGAARKAVSFEPAQATPTPQFRASMQDDLCVSLMHCVLQGVHKIDSVANTFTASIEIWVAWQLLEEDYATFTAATKDGKLADWLPAYIPQVNVLNAVSSDCELMSFARGKVLVYIDNGRVFGKVCQHMQVIAHEELELQSFPFDVQYMKLHLQIRDELHMGERFGVVYEDDLQVKIVRGAPCPPDWTMVSGAVWKHAVDRRSRDLIVAFRMKRNAGFFLRNIIFLLSITTFLGIAAFWIEEKSDKLAHVATMFLAGIAFQFIVSGHLPSVAYATLMDVYVQWSFLYLAAIFVVCTVTDAEATFVTQDTMFDCFLGNCMTSAWVVSHLLFAAASVCVCCRENAKLSKMEDTSESFHEVYLTRWRSSVSGTVPQADTDPAPAMQVEDSRALSYSELPTYHF